MLVIGATAPFPRFESVSHKPKLTELCVTRGMTTKHATKDRRRAGLRQLVAATRLFKCAS